MMHLFLFLYACYLPMLINVIFICSVFSAAMEWLFIMYCSRLSLIFSGHMMHLFLFLYLCVHLTVWLSLFDLLHFTAILPKSVTSCSTSALISIILYLTLLSCWTIITACLDQIQFYQKSKFSIASNHSHFTSSLNIIWLDRPWKCFILNCWGVWCLLLFLTLSASEYMHYLSSLNNRLASIVVCFVYSKFSYPLTLLSF